MDLKYVKELMAMLEKSDLHRIQIKEKNGVEVTLEKGTNLQPISNIPATPIYKPHQVIPAAATAPPMPGSSREKAASAEIDPSKCVKSPMVGTFYSAETPESPPFKKVGDTVAVGEVLCILEAMKVMNEVKSDKAGKITKILIADGDPVEYGQALFLVE